ncbi:MAG: protein kinase [Deltaproteobacteria bacterium]|nr:protein kinase [Deltaproteobacteria bacterium]
MKNIDRYEIIRHLGLGGMAEVFLARSRCAYDTDKLIVLKKILPKQAKNSRFIEMFIDEARVAMRLNHPNIVQVYSFEYLQGSYILTMEYMDGGNLFAPLRAMHKQGARLPFGLAAYITAEAAKGLDYVHSRCDDRSRPLEIVHRDVSPHNILLSREGAVKISDFGIARARCDEKMPNSIAGKSAYMPPEQATGLAVDRRSDVYALGMVLYEMLIGRHPLRLLPDADGRYKAYPSPRRLDPSVPEPLNEVVRRATSFESSNRYATARDMARALRQYLHTLREIYDDHALKSFMEKMETAEDASQVSMPNASIVVQSAMNRSAGVDDDHVTLSFGRRSTAVVISGRLTIEPHPLRVDFERRLLRLIQNITFKADGILQHQGSEFSVFLGHNQSPIGDPVRAVRLASDVVDATRALSRDSFIKVHVRLAVARGRIVVRQGGQETQWRLYPAPGLKALSRALINVVSPHNILVEEQIFQATKRAFSFEEQDAENIWKIFAVKSAIPSQLRGLKDIVVLKHGNHDRLSI